MHRQVHRATRRRWLGVLLLVGGCAQPTSQLAGPPAPPPEATDVPDLAAALPRGSPPDLALLEDLAVGGGVADDLAVPPLRRDLAMPPMSGCHLVINEVQTGDSSTGTDEFVEVYNPCTSGVVVDGVRLVYRATTNTNPKDGGDSSTLYSFPAGTLAAGGYRVLGGGGFAGAKDGALATGIAQSGAVGIRNAAGVLVDSVAYGSATSSAFVEIAAAPLPPTVAAPGRSIARVPNGADSDDNSRDFVVAGASTPGAAN
jgi:hypothetical protein